MDISVSAWASMFNGNRDILKQIVGERPYRNKEVKVEYRGKKFLMKWFRSSLYRLDGGWFVYEKLIEPPSNGKDLVIGKHWIQLDHKK